jgi:UDP-N-acetylmuramoyl-L-alanine---L-glutamate ligase
MRLADFAGKRVAIWGYGREGRAALTVLQRRFPEQPLTVFCNDTEAAGFSFPAAAERKPGLSILASPVDVEALRAFDIVIKSPGISPYKSPYREAEAVGVRFTSASAIWFAENSGAKTICITGTKGKSTVSALIAHLLRAGGLRIALAGNIGLPLLELIEAQPDPDWWVIELSSFQTRDFAGKPTVAVVNNLYEEHLDWHATRADYAADKLAIAARARHIVVNALQPELLTLGSTDQRTAFNAPDGWHIAGDAIFRGAERLLPLDQIPLPGLHNAQNVCAALAAIDAAGLDAKRLTAFVATFRPLPHRLQTLGERGGIVYVNDSISTTPYATIEALRSLSKRRVGVIVGGFDRGVDWQPFVDYVANYTPQMIVTMGANGVAIAHALHQIAQPGFLLESTTSLAEAVERSQAVARPGEVVLLSPGAPSFDQFHDYADRGREFARLTGFEASAIAQIDGLGIA